MMYVVMFIAAIQLKRKHAHLSRPFSIPGGRFGYYFTCVLGLAGCAITLLIGFFPPAESLEMGSANHFRLIFSSGIVFMLIPAFLLYLRKARR